MITTLALATALAAVTFYPSSGDRPGLLPRSTESSPRVEIARDLGPIVEITVRCGSGFAMLSFSKIERVYCSARGGCSTDFRSTASRACQGR